MGQLGILPRLCLALLPSAAGELADRWFPGCFFSESPFCIYYFHPPVMDLLFALLVLAPGSIAGRAWPARLLALLLLSVAVHALALGLLVGTRGSLGLPDLDTIFLNIVPIAIGASLVTGVATALIGGRRISAVLLASLAVAGLPVAIAFLLDEASTGRGLYGWLGTHVWLWTVWHVSMCLALSVTPPSAAGAAGSEPSGATSTARRAGAGSRGRLSD